MHKLSKTVFRNKNYRFVKKETGKNCQRDSILKFKTKLQFKILPYKHQEKGKEIFYF